MAGINVLSDTLKVGSKLEKTSTLKGKDIIDSPENAAEVFAAMLSGSENLNANPKGHNFSKAGQESEEKPSAGNPVQNVQNLNGQGSMLGCGNFALSFLTQPMLQRDLPAGKEANSGNSVSQGTEGLAIANASLTNAPIVLGNKLELAMLNLISLASEEVLAPTGIVTPKPQGDNPEITELDKYRQVIADLLVALSGEIKDLSPKGNLLSLGSSLSPNVDPKGQKSSVAGQGLEVKQSTEDPVQSVQNLNERVSVLGHGNFELLFPTQPMLERDFSAGKEASSGIDVSQGTGGLATANASLTNAPIVSGNNLELAMLNLVSLASDEVSAQSGMATSKPQGDNSEIAELDKYRQVIADLLVALSGEIKDLSPKANSLSIKSFGLNDSSQDMAKVVQGWKMTDDVVQDRYAPRVEAASSQTTGRVEAAKVPQEGSATRVNSITNQALNQLETLFGGSLTKANLSSTQALNHSEASISELGAVGGVKTSSPKENPINSESVGTKEPSQDTEKIGRGQMTLTNEGVKNANGSNIQATKGEVQTANSEATLRVVTAKTSQEGNVTKANPSSTQALNHSEVLISQLGETGEIKTPSPKETPIGSESVVKKEFSPDTAYLVQGQRMKTDDVVQDRYAPRVEAVSSQTTGRVEAAIVSQEGSATRANLSSTQAPNHSEALISELGAMGGVKTSSPKENPISSESVGTKELRQNTVKVERGQTTLTNEVVKNASGSNIQAVNGEVQATKGEVALRVVTAKTSQEGSVTKVNSSPTQALNHPEALISQRGETGEIKTPSPKETPIGSESVVKKNFSPDTAYLVQGQRMKTDDVAQDRYAPKVEVLSSQTTGRVEAAKVPQEGSATRANSLLTQTLNHPEVLNILSAESIGTKDTSQQDMAKVVQGWKSLPNDVVLNDTKTSDQKGIQTFIDGLTTGPGNSNAGLNEKVSMLQAALYPIVRLEGKDLKESQGKNETLEAEVDVIDAISKGRSPAFSKPIKGMEDDLFLRKFQRAFSKEIPKEIDSAKSSETFGVKVPQNQNLSTGMGFAGNIVSVNSVETKAATIPVWQQISTVFREQVLNRHRELKELDIQLHPADLGKIQISLRWENGQVHLQVQASEASTGQILQNQLSELRQTLSNQGVNCGMLQMGQGGGERQQNSRGYEQSRQLNQNTQPNEDENLIQITNPLSLTQDVNNRINVTA